MLKPARALQDGTKLDGHVINAIRRVCTVSAPASYVSDVRARARASGLTEAVQRHDTSALFEWLIDTFSYQGISDRIAWRFMNEHGRLTWACLDRNLAASPSCPRLRSYWHHQDCRYGKLAQTCAEPVHLARCPLPSHDLRNGRLNQTAYALFLFIRDVCDGDVVRWLDARLAEADEFGDTDRAAAMGRAVLEPLSRIHGISFKVLSMAFAEILLGADPRRERWLFVGASMIAIDTLVHNWLHRSGCLRRLGAEHAYGPGCYAPGGCAAILADAARHIDARAFCPDGPAYFPRLVQAAIWLFCAESGLGICNGNRIDDRDRCFESACPAFDRCDREALRPLASRMKGPNRASNVAG